MKKLILAILFATLSLGAVEGDYEKWRKVLSREDIGVEIRGQDYNAIEIDPNKMAQYDFSPLFAYNRICYLGRMGDDYWRFHIVYDKVKKIAPLTYSVEGQTMFKGNYCDFNGEIVIKNVFFQEIDDRFKDEIAKQGTVYAEVIFNESKDQKGSGVFKGAFGTNWYIDMNDRLVYDDTDSERDLYANNQFAGVWTNYKTGAQKEVAWGHFQVPNSPGLNDSASDFYPSPEYYKNGWQLKRNDYSYDVCTGLYPPKWRKK